MGPSQLLKASGSKATVPKMGDYHRNITKLHKYVRPGPGQYNLPELFENYTKQANISGLKRNAQFPFGVKYPRAHIITKAHCQENLGLESPGVGTYSGVKDHTFD